MKLKDDIPVYRIYRHELIYDVAPCKKYRLIIFNSCALSFFNFDSLFFEYRTISDQTLLHSLGKIPRWRENSFVNIGSEVSYTKFSRYQDNFLKNSKKVLSMMYELTHSDTWLRKKALPYYLSLLNEYQRCSLRWRYVPCLELFLKIARLRIRSPRQFLLRIRQLYYHSLIQGIQRITHAPLIIYSPGIQLLTIEGYFVSYFHRIRTRSCNILSIFTKEVPV